MRGPEVHGLTLNYRGGLLTLEDRTELGTIVAGDRVSSVRSWSNWSDRRASARRASATR